MDFLMPSKASLYFSTINFPSFNFFCQLAVDSWKIAKERDLNWGCGIIWMVLFYCAHPTLSPRDAKSCQAFPFPRCHLHPSSIHLSFSFCPSLSLSLSHSLFLSLSLSLYLSSSLSPHIFKNNKCLNACVCVCSVHCTCFCTDPPIAKVEN